MNLDSNSYDSSSSNFLAANFSYSCKGPSDCPSGYYSDSSTMKCAKCKEPCLNCFAYI